MRGWTPTGPSSAPNCPKFKSQNVTLLENSKILGMSEIRAAALKGAKFDYDREVEGVRALVVYMKEFEAKQG